MTERPAVRTSPPAIQPLPDPAAVFLVLVHDVAPRFSGPLRAMLGPLRPLVGQAVAGAVVPRWHGEPPPRRGDDFARLVAAAFGELLLHGYTHRCGRSSSLIALLTGRANEFTGLAPAAARWRLRQGQAAMAALFGAPARGFVPPAWQYGPLSPALLRDCGFAYSADLLRLRTPGRRDLPLAVWSWDWGRLAFLGPAGAALGAARLAARRDAVPCVVFHPADVGRGYLPQGLRLIRRLLAAGRRPVLPGDLAPRDCSRFEE